MKKPITFFSVLFTLVIISCNTSEKEQPKNGTIKAGNFNVYYEREGKGEPVVLLHAGLQDHTMWEQQVKALSARYEVITPDLPYHGQTMGDDTTILIADVIKALLDSLGIEKASIGGLSMGASATQDFVIAYPQRVNKAIIISSGLHGYESQLDSLDEAWYSRFIQALNADDTSQAAIEFTKAWAEGPYRAGDSLKASVSQYIYKKTLENLRKHKMSGWLKLDEEPTAFAALSTIKMPVLIIEGDKDLPFISRCSQYMEKNIAGAKRVVIKDVAHMLNIEKPEEVNALLLDFLKEK